MIQWTLHTCTRQSETTRSMCHSSQYSKFASFELWMILLHENKSIKHETAVYLRLAVATEQGVRKRFRSAMPFNKSEKVPCPHCQKILRRDNLSKHMKSQHSSSQGQAPLKRFFSSQPLGDDPNTSAPQPATFRTDDRVGVSELGSTDARTEEAPPSSQVRLH